MSTYAIYDYSGESLSDAYNVAGEEINEAYNKDGEVVWQKTQPIPLPVLSGDLYAAETIPLPDIYEEGKGFTCTGLAYDSVNECFLVGDIGILSPGSGTIRSQIVRVSTDFSTIISTIPLYETFPNMSDIQGITIDTRDNTIWFCSPNENKIRHITQQGVSISDITVQRPTGISFDTRNNSLWVLTYNNKIIHIDNSGTVVNTDDFAYEDTLDQCFIDATHGYLYIVAGANYSTRNNVYLYDTSTSEQSIACTVDSYSVEGLWLGVNSLVIVNDGYYHNAHDPRNVANFYDLSE